MDDGSLPPWTRHEEQGDPHPDPPDDTSPLSPNVQSASSFSFGGINASQESSGIATGHVEEEDICRVCRENTPGVPLLHPCKCSGSIKYVHQDCLLQWIKTKKVTKCELCKYPFKLSKVYDPQMPSRVPHRLFLQRLIVQLRNNLLTYLRFLLVCFIWLGLVPFCARWIWRFYFRFGDWSSSSDPSPSTTSPANTSSPATTTTSATSPSETSTSLLSSDIFDEGFFGWLKGQDIWTSVLRDCFQGQIITLCLVGVFVVVFLIREWVMQNAINVIEEPVAGAPAIPPLQVREVVVRVEQPQEERPEEPPPAPDTDDDDDDEDEDGYWVDGNRLSPYEAAIALRNQAWRTAAAEARNQGAPLERTPPPPNDEAMAAAAVELGMEMGRRPRAPPPADDPPPPLPPLPWLGPMQPNPNPPRQWDVDLRRGGNGIGIFDDDEEVEADDFDGLWDILGMQGPIIGLLHNTVFSALMIALAVGLGVWLPFMFGKTALGALAHPVDVLVQHPLTMVRLATDILLDASIFVIGGTLLTIHNIIRHIISTFSIPIPRLSTIVEYLDKTAYGQTYLSLTQSAGHRIIQAFSNSTARVDETSFLDHPFLTTLKEKLTSYTNFSSLHGTITEKVVAVIAGYLIFTCLGAIYLRVRKFRDTHDVDNTERLIRDILRQAGAVLKVVVIITIELVFFPIFCGILLDFSLLPLFGGATIMSRWDFAQKFTFTATFLHWFAGTLYMFHFAMFVSMCRDLVRAGTLYFIRDPNDPQFHPIREILERPTFHQLRKIGVSGIIYAFLILACFGIIAKSIEWCGGDVLPLKISTMEPVFEVPVDLLVSHIALPLTAHFVKPSNVVKTAWKWWFQVTARTLRLSSFLFGTRVPDEEGSIPLSEMIKFKRRPRIEEIPDDKFLPNGSFLRVPATDTIPLHRRKQVLIPVSEDNVRLDGIQETDEQRNDMDFRVVYVPPNFSTRITILFTWMWLFSIILGLSVTLVPLLLGRRLFSVLFGAETKMHDIYAYGIGLYTLIATVLITEFIIEKAQLLRNQQASLTSALKTGLIRLAKWTYLLLIAGILLPLVYGACLDLYVMIPFKRFISPDSAVEMQLLQDWTFGVIHLKIAGRIILYLDGRLAQSLRNVFPGHWTNPNIWLASTKFIFPMIVMGYVALLFPPAIYYIWAWAKWISGFPDGEEDFKSRVLMAYPIVMVVAIVFGAVWLARRAIDKWRDSVRDEIYLVGEVLHNLDETER